MDNEELEDSCFCEECGKKSDKRIDLARQIVWDTITNLEISNMEIIYLLESIKFQIMAANYSASEE